MALVGVQGDQVLQRFKSVAFTVDAGDFPDIGVRRLLNGVVRQSCVGLGQSHRTREKCKIHEEHPIGKSSCLLERPKQLRKVPKLV